MKILQYVEVVTVTILASDDHYIFHHYAAPSGDAHYSITKFNNHYHVYSDFKLVSITLCCSDVYYTILTVHLPCKLFCIT